MSPRQPAGGDRPSALDKLFGGRAGAAERARSNMRRSYGPKKGQTVFDATVIRRQAKKKRFG